MSKIDKELLNNPAVEKIAKAYIDWLLAAKGQSYLIQSTCWNTFIKEQQVEEPEWEIMKFKNDSGIWYYNEKLTISQKYRQYCLSHMEGVRVTQPYALEHSNKYSIHTIRIKATGEQISIGDKVKWNWISAPTKGYYTVKEFAIDKQNQISIYVEEATLEFNGPWKTWNLRKYTPPIPVLLLITEDQVGITDEMETVYGISPTDWAECTSTVDKIIKATSLRMGVGHPAWKWYSTEKARQEYIAQNKPMFSIAEIEKAMCTPEDFDWDNVKPILLKQAAEKIKGGN